MSPGAGLLNIEFVGGRKNDIVMSAGPNDVRQRKSDAENQGQSGAVVQQHNPQRSNRQRRQHKACEKGEVIVVGQRAQSSAEAKSEVPPALRLLRQAQ